jgi:aryl-alcohol dehydrogenase-like predicted oxidoreductase
MGKWPRPREGAAVQRLRALLPRSAGAVRTQDFTVAPIPGTKRVARVEENVAADTVVLNADQIARLDNFTPAAGEHHNEAQMGLLER